jgi:meso-butanediol dehydrogenase / (S,S)-butanediol dehydrogenase / diacetyl reductase
MNREVLVVIGVGGIGQAIARRQGSGKAVLLADFNEQTLEAVTKALEAAGHNVTTHHVDVSSHDSVRSLVNAVEELGSVVQVVHTAGLSPVQANPSAILAVDLLGTALILEEFGRVIAPGGAGAVISNMAGYMSPPLEPEQEEALARTPADELLQLPFLGAETVTTSAAAYGISKRANHLRVQAASVVWGDRDARVNSISPGIILTPLAQQEMNSEGGPVYRAMIETSASGRVGTTDEVASAAAYLLGPDSAFITGSDLLIDGGVIAALRAGRLHLPG